MPLKITERATDPEIREWEGGLSWVAHPGEGIRRASHAVVADGEVWIVEPVDFDGLDDRVGELGPLAGVVTLMDRHRRDAAAVAERHDVAVHVPAWMDGVAGALAVPTERFAAELDDTGLRTRTIADLRGWQECALFDGETLLVPETLGTAGHFRAGNDRLGMHPFARVLPPRRQLGDLAPERVLTGHGMGVFEDAASALADTLANARRRIPWACANALRTVLPG